MITSPEYLVEKLLEADFVIESWSVLGAGQNSVAILANDEWVFRTPMHSSAAESFDREIAVLKLVHGSVPVSTPKPEIVADVPGLEWKVMGYPLIPGEALKGNRVNSLGAESLNRLGRDLGRFMKTVHAAPVSQLGVYGAVYCDSPEQWKNLSNESRDYLKSRVESHVWNRLNRKLGKSIDKIERFEFEPAIRHGDFGFGNFLFDRQDRLSGVIDFGSAGVGDPAVDVASLIARNGPGEKFIDRVRPAYPDVDDMLERALIYRETFALQHALLAAKSDDEVEVRHGLTSYLGE